jgi:hypothetical protein
VNPNCNLATSQFDKACLTNCKSEMCRQLTWWNPDKHIKQSTLQRGKWRQRENTQGGATRAKPKQGHQGAMYIIFQSPIVWVTTGKKGQIMFQSRLVYVMKVKEQIMFRSPHVTLATLQFSIFACRLDKVNNTLPMWIGWTPIRNFWGFTFGMQGNQTRGSSQLLCRFTAGSNQCWEGKCNYTYSHHINTG